MRDDDDDDEALFHVTYANRIGDIAEQGLQPWGAPAFVAEQAYSAGKVFLTERDGISFWYERLVQYAEHVHLLDRQSAVETGFVPVVLSVSAEEVPPLHEDARGTRDALADAYYVTAGILPESLELWDGAEWIPIEDVETLDLDQAVEIEEEEEDGEVWLIHHWAEPNPLEDVE